MYVRTRIQFHDIPLKMFEMMALMDNVEVTVKAEYEYVWLTWTETKTDVDFWLSLEDSIQYKKQYKGDEE